MSSSAVKSRPWTFLTNHAYVLLCIARDPVIRLRDVAEQVGITERAAQRIVADLVAEGYVSRVRAGRRNQYRVNDDLPLRHPLDRSQSVGALLSALGTPGSSGERASSA
jgi:predicted transcriptional regulator of viral defense system